MARVLNGLGLVALERAEYAQAEQLLADTLALARRVGDQVLVPRALLNLGHTVLRRGDRRRAEGLVREGLHLLREVGDRGLICDGLNNLAIMAAGAGRRPARVPQADAAHRPCA